MRIIGMKITEAINNLKQSPLKRYYIGIGALAFVVAVIVSSTFIGSAGLAHDYELEREISSTKNKVENYINKNKKLPQYLPDVGITNSKGITYEPVGESRYLLCADFKTKSSGYTMVSNYDQFSKDITSSLSSGASMLSADTHYSDGDTSGLKHEKGFHCIAYESQAIVTYLSKQHVICDNYRASSKLADLSRISRVNESAKTISVVNINPNTELGTKYLGTADYYLNDTVILDASCRRIQLSNFRPGDFVEIYYDQYVSSPSVIKLTDVTASEAL